MSRSTVSDKYALTRNEVTRSLPQFHQILGKGHDVIMAPSEQDLVGWDDSRKRWIVGVSTNHNLLIALHEGGHQKWSLFDDGALSKLSPNARSLWNILEDARIDTLATAWFDRPVWDYHRDVLLRSYKTTKGLEPSHMNSTLIYLYGLSEVITSTVLEDPVIQVFGDRILACTTSSAEEVLQLAVEIAEFLKLTETEPPTKTKSSAPTSDKMTTGGPDDLLKAYGEQPDDVNNLLDMDSPQDMVTHPSGPKTEDEDIVTATPKITLTSADAQLIAKVARQLVRSIKTRATSERLSPITDTLSSTRRMMGACKNTYVIKEVAQTPVPLDQYARILLSDFPEVLDPPVEHQRQGVPTTHTWKASYGDLNVFARPPKHRGQLLVLVDLSGSMGCWCSSHNSPAASLAFQAAKILANSTNSTFFGFCSNSDSSAIVPLQPGHQPICRSNCLPNLAGNPDCVALQFGAEQLQDHLSGSTLIIISDGVPAGPAPLRHLHLLDHTRYLAKEYHARGLKFASILIGEDASATIYPASITVWLGKPKDLLKLRDTLAWLRDY